MKHEWLEGLGLTRVDRGLYRDEETGMVVCEYMGRSIYVRHRGPVAVGETGVSLHRKTNGRAFVRITCRDCRPSEASHVSAAVTLAARLAAAHNLNLEATHATDMA